MKVLKPQTGSAILTTIFLLFGILIMAMIGLEIVMSSLTARRAQGASTKAIFAAEAGIERATMAFKLHPDLLTTCDALSNPDHSGYLSFCSSGDTACEGVSVNVDCLKVEDANKKIYHLANSDQMPAYWVKATITNGEGETERRIVQLNSRGNFQGTSRELYVKFCLPDCFGITPGESDGCGGTCK